MSRLKRQHAVLTVAALIVAVLGNPAPSFAQLNGQNLKGDVGLKSGSQAPPGGYVAIPLYFYTADKVKDQDGREVLSANIDAAVYGAAVSMVTSKKLLGGNYAFAAVLAFANDRLQGIEDLDVNPGSGLTDMFVQPISLGWHKPRADFTAAYGLFVPIGRYEDGATNNTGLGMWAQEALAGTTVYLTKARTVHAATTMSIDWQSKKEDSETKVGTILNLEGGLGGDFLGGGLTAGLAYYGTFKLTDDQFDNRLGALLVRGKNKVWGLGPEVTLAIAAKKVVYGFVTVRYQWEMEARTTTEGAAWNIQVVLPFKPIHLP